MVPKTVFFFFLRENQKCAWNHFFAFFSFFSRAKKFFTNTFLNIFTGTLAFSRALSEKNSRIDFDFSRVETQEFSRKGSDFHAYSFSISECPNRSKFELYNCYSNFYEFKRSLGFNIFVNKQNYGNF